MVGSVNSPFKPDLMQRITEVHWGGGFAVIECYATSGNSLGGALDGGLEMSCSFPSFDPPNVDPASVAYAFPPSQDMRRGARAWAEPFLLGDPFALDQSIHTFTVNLNRSGDAEFTVRQFGGGGNINFVTNIVVRVFSHTNWRKEIISEVGGISVIARDGPVMLPQSGQPAASRVVTSVNPAAGAATARVTVRGTPSVAWV